MGGSPSRKIITVNFFLVSLRPIINGHRWSDIQYRRLLEASLDAADWFSEIRSTLSDLTLQTASKLLVEKYKRSLPEQELINRIMAEPKRHQETYQEYAQRLLNMVDSLPRGLAVDANGRQALHTFIKRTYYKYTYELKSFVDRLPSAMLTTQKPQMLVDLYRTWPKVKVVYMLLLAT
ncbi:LOW QUALITY PROTEIN: hypothetical protein PHMEG_0004690 [Phytophthora megakarya]|uniref:Uncharacterized protein n=1 Tax=Phytophthora megakarya TaxID=4795 RepID=A0A225WUX5_9STRA|nr:LOW QUALITY PROTEIN: hypothetical protein PHMEG_0004690 [Phytophthora megakarya]